MCVFVGCDKSAHKVSALRVLWYATGRIRVDKFKLIIVEPANTKGGYILVTLPRIVTVWTGLVAA